jgi:hypothetical protein
MRKPNNNKKSSYKGPFPKNPEVAIHNVKKSMRTPTDGPTVDTFSNIDTTTNYSSSESLHSKPKTQRPKRPTKEKPKKWNVSLESVFIIIVGFIAAGVGIIVYTHSNKFVSVEKDIEYIKDDVKENKTQLEKVIDINTTIDRKIDLLKQKVDIEPKKK